MTSYQSVLVRYSNYLVFHNLRNNMQLIIQFISHYLYTTLLFSLLLANILYLHILSLSLSLSLTLRIMLHIENSTYLTNSLIMVPVVNVPLAISRVRRQLDHTIQDFAVADVCLWGTQTQAVAHKSTMCVQVSVKAHQHRRHPHKQ
jgi:hypothetical protein